MSGYTTEAVTCRHIAVGDTIIPNYLPPHDGVRRSREVVPMVVAEIRERRPAPNDRRVTYFYFDADGACIGYSGGGTKVHKVVAQ